MRVLIGCEFSATVRESFRRHGHDAWSCDLLPSELLGPHLQCDIVKALDEQWDLIILHLPCTAIALCGNATYGRGCPKHTERLRAIEWTAAVWRKAISVCDRVAFENPKNVMGPMIGKRTQVIQPYEFGHAERKETWLWLHGVPILMPTDNVYAEMMTLPKKQRERLHYMSPGENRGQERSRTFQGIADAMADQWGRLSARQFCPSCEASVTDIDYEAEFCTQCAFGLLTEDEREAPTDDNL